MRMFYITAELELVSGPKWLDSFRKKYDEPHPYHITLKNPSFVNEDDIEKLKKLFLDVTNDKRTLKIKFSKLKTAQTDKGHVIMIGNKTNTSIRNLQKEVSTAFSRSGEHTAEKYKNFEKHFEPHITIARRLSDSSFEKAKKELVFPVTCTANINQIVLTIVKDWDINEQNNPKNRTVVKLK